MLSAVQPEHPASRLSRRGQDRHLSVTIDPATFRVLDLGLSKHAPVISLSTFGPVTRLV